MDLQDLIDSDKQVVGRELHVRLLARPKGNRLHAPFLRPRGGEICTVNDSQYRISRP